jgi:hypothetical protein
VSVRFAIITVQQRPGSTGALSFPRVPDIRFDIARVRISSAAQRERMHFPE